MANEFNLDFLIEKIEELCSQKQMSVKSALEDCGLTRGVVDNMKKGSVPSVDKMLILANYFDVSVDYLLGKEHASLGSKTNYSYIHDIGEADVSEDAIEIDKVLRSLNHKDRINVISAFYDIVDNVKKRAKTTSYKYKLKTEFFYNWT